MRATAAMSGNPLPAKFQIVFLRSDIGFHFNVQQTLPYIQAAFAILDTVSC
jgi:hypothetical protein